jgi:microcompartment protein CcmL/EutN
MAMKNYALGLVEVRGYLGAISAADAALKAASVTCIGLEIIKGGLVTVKITGDVGAVQAAVEAGAETAKQLNVLLTRHVIARMHEETAAIVMMTENDDTPSADTSEADAVADATVKKEADVVNTLPDKGNPELVRISIPEPAADTSELPEQAESAGDSTGIKSSSPVVKETNRPAKTKKARM